MANSFGTKDEHRVKSLKGWFTITGRMGRKEYWSRLIAFFVVLVPCAIIQAIPVLGQIVGLVVGLTGYIAMTTVFVRDFMMSAHPAGLHCYFLFRRFISVRGWHWLLFLVTAVATNSGLLLNRRRTASFTLSGSPYLP